MTTTYEQGSAARSPSGAPVLTLTGVQKRYGGVRALRGVDFELQGGEVHAIVGENGAGKSTLIKIVSGAESADEGSIVINGRELTAGSTTSALQAGIATVYQEPHLFGELTVAENLFIGREIRRHGIVDRGAQRERVVELLERIGLSPDLAEVRGGDLPVAEQQLVTHRQGPLAGPRRPHPRRAVGHPHRPRDRDDVHRGAGHARRGGRGDLHQPPPRRAGPDHRPGHRAARRCGGRQPAPRRSSRCATWPSSWSGTCWRPGPMDRAPTAAEPALGVEHLTRARSSQTSRSPCAPARSWRSTD